MMIPIPKYCIFVVYKYLLFGKRLKAAAFAQSLQTKSFFANCHLGVDFAV